MLLFAFFSFPLFLNALPSDFHSLEKRMIGGRRVGDGNKAFPFMASLQDKIQPLKDSHFCGGVMIAENLVLTAAHCVAFMPAEEVRVSAKRYKVKKTSEKEEGIDFNVEKWIIHENYDTLDWHDDIAIGVLKLDKNYATYEDLDNKTPAGFIPTTRYETDINQPLAGAPVTVLGWGDTDSDEDDEDFPTTLRKVTVPIVTTDTCKQWYNFKGNETFFNNDGDEVQIEVHYSDHIYGSNICAGTEKGGVDACSADSGGPLLAEDGTVQGLVSWGVGCGNAKQPGVYTKVSHYADWIQRIVDANPGTGNVPVEKPDAVDASEA